MPELEQYGKQFHEIVNMPIQGIVDGNIWQGAQRFATTIGNPVISYTITNHVDSISLLRITSGVLWHLEAPDLLWRNPTTNGREFDDIVMNHEDAYYLSKCGISNRFLSGVLHAGVATKLIREYAKADFPYPVQLIQEEMEEARSQILWASPHKAIKKYTLHSMETRFEYFESSLGLA